MSLRRWRLDVRLWSFADSGSSLRHLLYITMSVVSVTTWSFMSTHSHNVVIGLDDAVGRWLYADTQGPWEIVLPCISGTSWPMANKFYWKYYASREADKTRLKIRIAECNIVNMTKSMCKKKLYCTLKYNAKYQSWECKIKIGLMVIICVI